MEANNTNNEDYILSKSDWEKEHKAFADTNTGVKGLLDSGVKNVPKMFIRPSTERLKDEQNAPLLVTSQGPVISLEGIEREDRRDEIAKQILSTAKKWGFFQLVDHGVPSEVLDNFLKGCRMFHDQDAEAKKEFYTRDLMKTVAYTSSNEFYQEHQVRFADWRDFLAVHQGVDPQELPEICRDAIMEYTNHVVKLGDTVLELLSSALGASSCFMKEFRKWYLNNNYYPPCPEPELTIGFHQHTDSSFVTLLVQDQIGGLQVLHDDKWIEIKPIPGAISVITGDLLEIASNDMIKALHHKVPAKRVGPRVSAAVFFLGNDSCTKLFGPIRELISEENPAVYIECTLAEYYARSLGGPGSTHGPDHMRIGSHGATTM